VTAETAPPSARQTELLEAAYQYALEHGLADLSLRPLATAVGSSPRVLLYLFGSKDAGRPAGLALVAERTWAWLVAAEHRALLTLWVEAYARSLVDPEGPWAEFARATVQDWLAVLAAAQPAPERDTAAGLGERTLVLAVLRGALLDLLATGDTERVTAAVTHHLKALTAPR
jgi:AcrR family transcriptional regulator